MGLYADFQNTMSNPEQWTLGVPTVDLLDGYTYNGVAVAALTVGGAAFISDQADTSTSLKPIAAGTETFGGIILRSNQSGMQWSDVTQGYSQTIGIGKPAQVMTRGSVPIYISAANEVGGVPLKDSIVYVIKATGLFVTQSVGGTAPSDSQVTNFRVKRVKSGWTTAALVEVTNIQNVGA